MVTTHRFTDDFIRDTVLPEIARSGGATVETSHYGEPLRLLAMDQFQPPTWVVGGMLPFSLYIDPDRGIGRITSAANSILDAMPRSIWGGVGFWHQAGVIVIDAVETYTHHGMARDAGVKRGEMAIYAMHSGETEVLVSPRQMQRYEEYVRDVVGQGA